MRRSSTEVKNWRPDKHVTSESARSQDGLVPGQNTWADKSRDRFGQMRHYDELAWQAQTTNSPGAPEYAHQALSLHESLKSANGVHRSFTVLARAALTRENHNDVLSYLERALPMARSVSDIQCIDLIYRTRAEVMLRLRQLDKARVCIELARNLAKQHGRCQLSINLIYANVLVLENKIVRAIEICESVYQLALRDGNELLAAPAATHLCAIFRIIGEFNKSRKFGELATTLNERNGYGKNQISVYMSLAECAIRREDFQQATEYYRLAEERAKTLELHVDRITVILNRASLYLVLDQVEGAAAAIREARQALGPQLSKVHSAIEMLDGEVALKQGQYQQALHHFNTVLNAAVSMPEFDRWQIHQGLALAHEALQQNAEALQHHKLYVEMFERTRGHDVQQRIATIEQRYEQKRANSINELLHVQISQLNKQVKKANAELAELALATAQRTIGLESLRGNIEQEIKRAPNDAHNFLHKMRASVEALMGDHETWQAFDEQFNRIHAGFKGRLAKRHPDLSPAEIHICSLMLVGLRSKDIAEILHVSLHTVNTHRQNIRKKLVLGRGNNLGNYLTAL